MDDVSGEVDAEPDGDDEGHAGQDVHREAPEVHEAGDLGDCGDDADQDEQGASETCKEEQDCDEDGSYSTSQVLEKFLLDHLVSQPVGVER